MAAAGVALSALGLGRVPPSLGQRTVVVRQPAAFLTGAFLVVVFGAMAVAVLIDPSVEDATGKFFDRWVFGAVVVPAAFGIHRFLLRPRIVLDPDGVRLVNAFSFCPLPWGDVADARSGRHFEVVGTDGDSARALIYGPAFSGPLTSESRPRALVALIRAEAARRSGREPPPEDYAASPLVADGSEPVASEPVIHPRTSYGLAEAAAIAGGWTIACAIAAALA